MAILEEIEKYRNEVVTDTYTTTWREILGQFKDGDLKIDPEYQRLFRWDVDQQTQYIESILLNIPSPPLFFAENSDGGYEVIDGLQRLSTLIRFFSEEIFDTPNPTLDQEQEDGENNIAEPLVLAEGPIIKSLGGFSAKTLPEALVRTIRYARITIILLEKESSRRARFEVFKRLNKQGSLLSDQEIRNCTGRIFGSEFPAFLKKLAATSSIRTALGLSSDDERKMRVEEMILRLLAFNHSPQEPNHNVSEFLDEFMVFASEGKFRLSDSIENRVLKSFEMIAESFPDGRAFRLARGIFSTNLFDILATGVYKNLETLDSEKIKNLRESLIASSDFKALTGAGSNTRKKMTGRINLGLTWFA